MFDKLVVSEPDRAEIKGRRKYFMVSSLVVGVLFITAVVVSIFSADFGLGNSNFESTEMLAPVEMAAVTPEQVRPQPAAPSRSTDVTPTRQVNMLSISETPKVPDTISTIPNNQMSRPTDRFFKLGSGDTNPNPGGSGREAGPVTDHPSGLAQTQSTIDPPVETPPPPPRVEKPKTSVSKGVINGIAKYLPKPVYSATARAVGAQGKVDVQVTIDETGNVISARAASGHPLLRPPAESAARRAKFSQTFLSDVPVKVTGVIVYNFVK